MFILHVKDEQGRRDWIQLEQDPTTEDIRHECLDWASEVGSAGQASKVVTWLLRDTESKLYAEEVNDGEVKIPVGSGVPRG
jgi:hypothetical protein